MSAQEDLRKFVHGTPRIVQSAEGEVLEEIVLTEILLEEEV